MQFASAASAQSAFIPLFLKGKDANFVFLKPDYPFFFAMILWIMLQLVCLKLQQKNPRFFLTRRMRQSLNQGYYRYEVTFDEEAAVSNGTYNSNQSQYRDLKELPAVDRKKFERELRSDTLKAKECIICFEELKK